MRPDDLLGHPLARVITGEALHTIRGRLQVAMIARVQNARGFDGICREAARQMRALTGFDRVMVYCFGPDGAGEVIEESAVRDIGSRPGAFTSALGCAASPPASAPPCA